MQKIKDAWRFLQRLMRNLFLGVAVFAILYLLKVGAEDTGKEKKQTGEKRGVGEKEGKKENDKEEVEGGEGEKEEEGVRGDKEKEEEGREERVMETPAEETCEQPPVSELLSMFGAFKGRRRARMRRRRKGG